MLWLIIILQADPPPYYFHKGNGRLRETAVAREGGWLDFCFSVPHATRGVLSS